MAYGTYKTLEEVGTKFDIESLQKKFINETPFEIPELIYNLYQKNLENISLVLSMSHLQNLQR